MQLRARVCAGCHTTRVKGWRQDGESDLVSTTEKRELPNMQSKENEAIHPARNGRHGLPRCARNDVDMLSRSRGIFHPRFERFVALHLRRGRREDRVHAAPAVSRASAHGKSAHEHTGSAGASRPSLRNGFTAYFALFPENGSFASVACASYRKLSASTAAPEPRDFTVRIGRVRLARLLRPPHPTARS